MKQEYFQIKEHPNNPVTEQDLIDKFKNAFHTLLGASMEADLIIDIK